MLYYYVAENKLTMDGTSPQDMVLAEHLFGGLQVFVVDKYKNVKSLAIGASLDVENHAEDVVLVDIGDQNIEFADTCASYGVRAVCGLTPEKLLHSDAWDLMKDILRISKEHNANKDLFYTQEALTETIGEAARREERGQIDFLVEMVVDEMARKTLKRIMRR